MTIKINPHEYFGDQDEKPRTEASPSEQGRPATIKQITTAGCNRECFALTDEGELYLLRYYDVNFIQERDGQDHSFEWEKIEQPPNANEQ